MEKIAIFVFLNCQYKVGISAKYFFPFISFYFVKFITVTRKFGTKTYDNYYVLKELICQDKYKKMKLKLKYKMPDVNFV